MSLHMDYIILFPTEDDKEGFIITSMLQMRKQIHIEPKYVLKVPQLATNGVRMQIQPSDSAGLILNATSYVVLKDVRLTVVEHHCLA